MEICSANCASVRRRFSNAERMEGQREESDCMSVINSVTHFYTIRKMHFNHFLKIVVNKFWKEVQDLDLNRRS